MEREVAERSEVGGIVLYKHDKDTVAKAKALRKEMTREERHLWYDFLRGYPVKFTRQKVIGPYIVDFYCASAKLVIELDGSQHYTEEGLREDQARTTVLEKYGLKVIRFLNRDIDQNFKAICHEIDNIIQERIKK